MLCLKKISISNPYTKSVFLSNYFSRRKVRALACSSWGIRFESTHSITQMWWFKLLLRPTVRFQSLGWIKVGHLLLRPGLGNNEKAPMGMRVWHTMLNVDWMSELRAHTKNNPSHPIVEYHPYSWEHYSQVSWILLYSRLNWQSLMNYVCL